MYDTTVCFINNLQNFTTTVHRDGVGSDLKKTTTTNQKIKKYMQLYRIQLYIVQIVTVKWKGKVNKVF